MHDVFQSLLFVGNAIEARDNQLLYENDIAVVIDLAINEPPAVLHRELCYIRIPLHDGSGNNDNSIRLAIITITELLRQKRKTLIACSFGMSRSPCLAAAGIANFLDIDLEQSLSKIAEHSPNDISPVLWQNVLKIYNNMRNGQ